MSNFAVHRAAVFRYREKYPQEGADNRLLVGARDKGVSLWKNNGTLLRVYFGVLCYLNLPFSCPVHVPFPCLGSSVYCSDVLCSHSVGMSPVSVSQHPLQYQSTSGSCVLRVSSPVRLIHPVSRSLVSFKWPRPTSPSLFVVMIVSVPRYLYSSLVRFICRLLSIVPALLFFFCCFFFRCHLLEIDTL